MLNMFFDDFAVGQVFETKVATVSSADILAFANAFDPNPFHLDKAAARCHGFPDIIAPGMHTLSLSLKLFFDLNLWDEAVLPSPGMENVRWHRPVLPDTTMFVRATVSQMLPSRSKPDWGIIKVHQETLDRSSGALLLTVDALHRLKRR
ncbi:MaoC family dehydratase N-terminal domain-containing protein [Paracoccus versutus]|uniref:MaoC/PaaZ C-terminal domain-containing protein n=1 Tax=Paracoccus versutus TaxID=34007 RepID=UPI001FB66DF0|nr:MaoC/PaaZ C-terminal domain-containing protein [Paracoccus versutus]MCJ1901689.1 MaoC family dehydratase N-terminal domain-containing protein [Paracoccus versutus]